MNFSRITTICILLLLAGFNITAQLVSVEEVKGIDSTFIKEESKHSFHIRNKNNVLRFVDSYFIEYAQLGGQLPEIIINNKGELDVYVRVFIAPFFKMADREFSLNEMFSIDIYADQNGNIKELEINYPKDVDIPIAAIEQFENAIRTSNLRLVFDKTHKAFAISPWIGRSFRYNSNTIKEMANNH